MAQSPLTRLPLVAIWLLSLIAICLMGLLPDLRRVATAQEGYRISIDQTTVSEQQDQVRAQVSVFDPAGRPVLGLTDFSSLVDGTHVPIKSITSVINQQAGISLLLLLDISGSMEGDKLAQARTAASTFVEGLLPQDVAAIVPFAGSVPNAINFTSDRDALLAAIGGLATQPGGTALYQAIVRGLSAAAQAPTARRITVLLTDGNESGTSQASQADALSAAATSNIPIFAIGLGADADTGFLQALATAAHGSFYQAPAPGELHSIFNTISARLRSQYEVVVPLPKATLSSRDLAVEARVGQLTLRAEAHFRTTVPAPKPSSGGGPPLWMWLGVIVLALPCIALATRRLRRPRRQPASPVRGGPGGDLALPARSRTKPETAIARAGKLTITEGPGTGQSVLVSATPVDIGTDPSCDLQLHATDSAVARRHARVWVQQDRLLVHHLAPGFSTTVGDEAVEWASLEPSDTLRLGPCRLVFSLETNATAEMRTLPEA